MRKPGQSELSRAHPQGYGTRMDKGCPKIAQTHYRIIAHMFVGRGTSDCSHWLGVWHALAGKLVLVSVQTDRARTSLPSESGMENCAFLQTLSRHFPGNHFREVQTRKPISPPITLFTLPWEMTCVRAQPSCTEGPAESGPVKSSTGQRNHGPLLCRPAAEGCLMPRFSHRDVEKREVLSAAYSACLGEVCLVHCLGELLHLLREKSRRGKVCVGVGVGHHQYQLSPTSAITNIIYPQYQLSPTSAVTNISYPQYQLSPTSAIINISYHQHQLSSTSAIININYD
ncbi:hypothetical protein RRG08_021279 [Elysia crispata]|uniref:Uncharacterized protein n=1 Tax=Elysia crispata TaxID=231223 RepID=A0AAE1DD60_9GAST|nr:hypothetical protein RRG08_021279 [Elysia crispata]